MEAFVGQTLGRAEEVGNRRLQGLCWHALGAVRYLTGDWAGCREALERGVALARSFGGTFGEVLGEQRLGLLETSQGAMDAAHERLEAALSVARASRSPMVRGHSIGRLLATLAHNRLEAGDLAGAAGYLAEGFAMQRRVGECPSCDVLLYPAAVPIYLALGDVAAAREACERAEQTAAAFRSQAWVATARYLRGRFAAAEGDEALARDVFEAALALFERLGQPFDVARTREALGDVSGALGLYERLGAADHVRRAGALLAGEDREPVQPKVRREEVAGKGRGSGPA